jgi:cystathionine gamma-lyase
VSTRGFAFSSGLAATSTILELLDAGSHIVAVDDMYGGSWRLFERVRKRSMGLRVSYADTAVAGSLEKALQPDTKMIWAETPSNPLLKVSDLALIAKIGKARGILTVVDNTFASPWLQRPLELGIDLVVHSVTKYINGHSDMVGELVVVGERKVAEAEFMQNAIGSILDPFSSFLALRGIQTLPLRMRQHCDNAMHLATGFSLTPGRADHLSRPADSSAAPASGETDERLFGAMIAIYLKTDMAGVRRALSVRVFTWPKAWVASRSGRTSCDDEPWVASRRATRD